MTVEEATRLFVEHAYMDDLPARKEAERGTFDPGYLNYTLGKLMLLKLRADYEQERVNAFSLGAFHDQFRLLRCASHPSGTSADATRWDRCAAVECERRELRMMETGGWMEIEWHGAETWSRRALSVRHVAFAS